MLGQQFFTDEMHKDIFLFQPRASGKPTAKDEKQKDSRVHKVKIVRPQVRRSKL